MKKALDIVTGIVWVTIPVSMPEETYKALSDIGEECYTSVHDIVLSASEQVVTNYRIGDEPPPIPTEAFGLKPLSVKNSFALFLADYKAGRDS